MNNYTLFLVFTGSAILNLGLAVYVWRRRHLPGATVFGLAMFLFAMLPLAQAVNINSAELVVKVIALKSRVEASGIGATLWLIMIMQLTGYSHLIDRRLFLALSVVPLAIFFLNWTENPLFRSNYFLDSAGMLHWNTGPIFWLGLLYLNALFLAPLYLLWHSYRDTSPLSLYQTLALSLSVILPIFLNLLIQLNIVSIPAINFPFAAGPLMGLIVIWAVFQYRIFNVIPVARSLLIEEMSDGVIVVDNHNNVVDINPAMLKLVGIDARAALGQNIETIFARWPDILTNFRNVNETQTEIVMDSSQKEYFDLRISPLYGRGKWEAGRVIVVRDVTKYKQTESKLRLRSAALNAAANAVMITDADDVIQWVNPAFTQLTGYTEEEAIGNSPKILRSGKHDANFYKAMHETSHSGKVWKGEVMNLRKDGTEYFEEQTITPVFDDNGAVSHFIAIKQDITARKHADMARTYAETELKRALKRTEILFDVTKIGISSRSLSSLLQETVEKVAQYLPADRASLLIFDVPSEKIKHFVHGGINADLVLLSVTFDELMDGLTGWAIRTGQTALSPKDIPDPRESKRVQQRRRETNCGSVLVTPLQYQGTSMGTLTLINLPEEPDFTEKDVELVEAVAGQISSAIVKVTLEENLQHQNKYLTTLHQVTFDLLNKREIADLLQSIVDRAAEFLNAPYCEIMLHEKDELVVKAYTRNQPFLAGDHVGHGEAFLSWKAFDTGTPVVIKDYSSWPQRREMYNKANLHATASLPILSQNGSIGVLDISRSTPGQEFDDFEIQAATLFAKLAALALENAQLHEALRQESIRDHLTGLFNRRFMEEALAKEISRAARKSAPLAVVMFDLDRLKEINDAYGHSAGDEALRRVSRVLNTKIRTGDVACRYGGDEFTLILADTTLENARQRMEELRTAIKQISIQHEGKSITTLTLSIGIAEYPEHGTTGRDLVKAADLALYQSKQAGRDRVTTA